MYCRKCGAKIEEGCLFCSKCGEEIQLVPEYNVLEDMVSNGVNTTWEEKTEKESQAESFKEHPERPVVNPKKNNKRKNKKTIIILGVVVLLVFAVFSFFLFFFQHQKNQQSYEYQIKKAMEYEQEGDYDKSLFHVNKALEIEKNNETGLLLKATVCMELEDQAQVQSICQGIISRNAESRPAYDLLISSYIKEEKFQEIQDLLLTCPLPEVIQANPGYLVDTPVISLAGGDYTEIQQITFEETDYAIYYTLDNTEPTVASNRYYEPLGITLDEGTTVLRAIAVNEKMLKSDELMVTYNIVLTVPDAPEVTPITGRYPSGTQAVIVVPEGCSVFYTLDGSVPGVTSNPYSGPISLTEESQVLSAIAIHPNGKTSTVIRRSYEIYTVSETAEGETTPPSGSQAEQ